MKSFLNFLAEARNFKDKLTLLGKIVILGNGHLLYATDHLFHPRDDNKTGDQPRFIITKSRAKRIVESGLTQFINEELEEEFIKNFDSAHWNIKKEEDKLGHRPEDVRENLNKHLKGPKNLYNRRITIYFPAKDISEIYKVDVERNNIKPDKVKRENRYNYMILEVGFNENKARFGAKEFSDKTNRTSKFDKETFWAIDHIKIITIICNGRPIKELNKSSKKKEQIQHIVKSYFHSDKEEPTYIIVLR